MIPEEAKKKHRLTQEDCDTARLLLARQRTLKEIADIIGVDPSTVGKIRVAEYNLEKYLAQRKEMNRKTKERKAAAEAGRRRLNELIDTVADEERDKLIYDQLVEEREAHENGMTVEMYRFCKKMREEQEREKQEASAEVPGQMQMQLDPPEEEAKQDDTKLMRFQAAMMDRLIRKLDELIGVLKGGGKDE